MYDKAGFKKKNSKPLLGTLLKVHDLSNSGLNIFLPVFATFTYNWMDSRGTLIQNNVFVKMDPPYWTFIMERIHLPDIIICLM
jgi:hypothetical protein